jgi:7-cyano-7-deazaguanine synthase
MESRAVVLLSGGQDSVTSLFWAVHKYDEVHAVSFDYGQRHRVELEQVPKILDVVTQFHGNIVPHAVLDMSLLAQLGGGGLTNDNLDVSEPHPLATELPASFVPGRNLLFLTAAAAYGYQHDAFNLVGGMCETDFSGYPDCRRKTIDAIEDSLLRGMERTFQIHTPLMHLTKEDSVSLARTLSGCWEALAESHTCYEGHRPACGGCPACRIRLRGFCKAGETDPLEYAA